jgi:phage tail-like protein
MPEAAQQSSQPTSTGAQPGTFIDPFRAYNFKLQIQGVTEGHFTQVTGLEVEVHPIRYREGGSTQVVHVIPGPVTYGDVTLSYGLTSSVELWQWLMSAVQGNVERRNVSILMLDSAGATEVVRWDLTNAWPARWRGAPLDALNREIAIESLTLVFETLQRA